MMSPLIEYTLIVFAIWIALILLYQLVHVGQAYVMRRSLIRVPIRSSNGALVSYYVKNHTNAQESAQLLADTRDRLFVLLTHLDQLDDAQIPSNLLKGVRRMILQHCHNIKISELDVTKHKVVAFNQGKGEHIYMCLRQCPSCSQLTQWDKVYIVAMHEMAHSAMRSYEPSKAGATIHGPEFRAYERYLAEVSETLGVVDVSKVVGGQYCDITIPDFRVDDT